MNQNPTILHPPKKAMGPGDVVFFKRARGGLGSTDRFAQFQGHGFGILLGHVPDGAPIPPLPLVLRQLGTFGFISFDDIIQLMGKEVGDALALRFGEKYYGKEAMVTGLGDAMPGADPMTDAEKIRALDSRARAAEATVKELSIMLGNFRTIVDQQSATLKADAELRKAGHQLRPEGQ